MDNGTEQDNKPRVTDMNGSEFLKHCLTDSDGNPSSKRLVTFIATMLICLAFLANLFWDETIEQFIFDGVMYIVIAGLGVAGAEKFAPKTPPQ